jgi:hypothetical protein
MKVGYDVNYYDPSTGERVDAEVEKIEGSAKNYTKVLTLVLERNEEGKPTKVVEGAKHLSAREEETEAFWLVKNFEQAPQGWADKPKAKKK